MSRRPRDDNPGPAGASGVVWLSTPRIVSRISRLRPEGLAGVSHLCYVRRMTTISVRQLRNDVSAVLRRAENGEVLTVTVSGRPTARIVPLRARPTSMPWSVFREALDFAAAGAELSDELAAALPDTTDAT